MPFNELELKRIDHTVGGLCRRKTRPEHAEQLRFECEIDGHTVSVWEVRPPWDGVGDHTRMGVARFRYFRSRGVWILYWMRRDLDPIPAECPEISASLRWPSGESASR